jgi:predicted DNA-binding transcriptional regulator YafY
MRADRLLSILMLLQSRGNITALQLASELEVSVRTIYRDIDALSTAGVPVYAERGPGGGCALVDGYRTSLTGLTRNEVKALFMLSVPASLDELGVIPELRAALRKLAASLPAAQRQDEIEVRQRIYLDWSDWPSVEESTPHLHTIYQATWENHRLHLKYSENIGRVIEQFERVVDPYGLVAKAGEWHLVCAIDGKIRVYYVSRILKASTTGEYFERPTDFDLIAFWKAWCSRQEETHPSYPVTARISPALIAILTLYSHERIHDAVTRAEPPDAEGWITVTLPFETFNDARRHILSFGRAVEVLDPEPLRLSVIDYAKQIVDFYSQ